jgi:uncharacterized protein (TIGR02452 family)
MTVTVIQEYLFAAGLRSEMLMAGGGGFHNVMLTIANLLHNNDCRESNPNPLTNNVPTYPSQSNLENKIMSDRTKRAEIAGRTVEILKTAGTYTAKDPATHQDILVNLQQVLEAACEGTFLHLPDKILHIPTVTNTQETDIYLSNETTLGCAQRLSSTGDAGSVGVLNFASAKNPGGGFLRGDKAQEESLACCSGLYSCLETAQAKPFYEFHNRRTKPGVPNAPVLLYSSNVIFSPHVPVFRSDQGDLKLLSRPYTCSMITSCAVNFNMGMMSKQIKPHDKLNAQQVMMTRALRVLQVAAHHEIDKLVLGAWGCGVFKNDPKEVAKAFQKALIAPQMEGRFKTVVFAIQDDKESKTFKQFAKIFSERNLS